MPDQATDLRHLVRQHATPTALPGAGRPWRIVVAGGKGGVGTTTIAVNLAVSLAHRGLRAVLVEATGRGDVAMLCRLDPRHTLADVLSGARSVAEALETGPGGARVLCGTRELESLCDCSASALDRLLSQLADLAGLASVVVLDAGNTPDQAAQRLWQAADELLLVTTPNAAAIMDAYASIKLLAGRCRTEPIHLLLNQTANPTVAQDTFQRLAQACRRFLGTSLTYAGHVPSDRLLRMAKCSTAAGHLHRLAAVLAEGLAEQNASIKDNEAERRDTLPCRTSFAAY
jgi:flagellar biosynthesis protein FlhG